MYPTNSKLLSVSRRPLLEFYDAAPTGSSRHANALNAIAGEDLGAGLMKHYLEKVSTAQVEILDMPCTPGTKSGGRLDRWLLAKEADRTVLFQVEIKNWSSNSLGGKRLALDATPEQIARHKQERWSYYWNMEERQLKVNGTHKVLTPMKSSRLETIEPVLCLWDAIHPEGLEEPFFKVSLEVNHHFSHLWFFSMSSYLRSITDETLEIEMPDTIHRLSLLKQLFPRINM